MPLTRKTLAISALTAVALLGALEWARVRPNPENSTDRLAMALKQGNYNAAQSYLDSPEIARSLVRASGQPSDGYNASHVLGTAEMAATLSQPAGFALLLLNPSNPTTGKADCAGLTQCKLPFLVEGEPVFSLTLTKASTYFDLTQHWVVRGVEFPPGHLVNFEQR